MAGFRNHGFTRIASKKKTVSPVVKAAAIAGEAKPEGAVAVRKQRQRAQDLNQFPPQPPWFQGPITEWICWWDLTENRKLKPQVDIQTGLYTAAYDFAYQAAARTDTEQRGFFRADFVFPPWSAAFRLGPDFPGGLILDPYSDETHPLSGADLLRRTGLSDAALHEALTIFLEQTALMSNPHWLIGEALQGIDHSTRGR